MTANELVVIVQEKAQSKNSGIAAWPEDDAKSRTKRWKEFLQDPAFGFHYIIGVSGTCYIDNDYFNDVIFRYSLRTSIEERYAKKVHYVAEMPKTDQLEEKWQLIYNRHQETKRKLRKNNLLPLTIIVTQTGESENVRYVLNPQSYKIFSTHSRQADSVSAAEISSGGHKTLFFTERTRESLEDEQIEFFDVVTEEGNGYKVILVRNRHDFKTPLSAVIADHENGRRFIRSLLEIQNSKHYDAWLKSTSTRFYEIDYAWKKRNAPKRGKFSPDFFIKMGDLIQVVEIKGDEELREPSEENIKKFKYAKEHFARLNDHLQQEELATRYRFNFLTPANFNTFFQAMRDGQLKTFTSQLDVILDQEERVE